MASEPELKLGKTTGKITSFLDSKVEKNVVVPLSADIVKKLFTEYIIEDILPISTVEKSGFQTLIKKLRPDVTVPTRRAIVAELEVSYYNFFI